MELFDILILLLLASTAFVLFQIFRYMSLSAELKKHEMMHAEEIRKSLYSLEVSMQQLKESIKDLKGDDR